MFDRVLELFGTRFVAATLVPAATAPAAALLGPVFVVVVLGRAIRAAVFAVVVVVAVVIVGGVIAFLAVAAAAPSATPAAPALLGPVVVVLRGFLVRLILVLVLVGEVVLYLFLDRGKLGSSNWGADRCW